LLSRKLQDAISTTNRRLIDINMIKAVLVYIKSNSHSVPSPFAIKDNNNTLLAPSENYLICLQNAYPELTARIASEEEIRNWAKNMIDQAKKSLKSLVIQGNANITKIATGDNVIINEFTTMYLALMQPT
jgi:hypothetical protein